MFDLNLGLTVWTSFVFLALLGILWKYAWGPVLAAVEARESGIQDTLDRAASEREEAGKLLAEHRQQMADARRQAQQLIAESREAGEGSPAGHRREGQGGRPGPHRARPRVHRA